MINKSKRDQDKKNQVIELYLLIKCKLSGFKLIWQFYFMLPSIAL